MRDFVKLERKRQNYLNALGSVIRESTSDGHEGLRAETSVIEEDGSLKESFKRELNELAQQELKNLHKTLASKTPINPDLFGVKRSFCELCNEKCQGYEPSKYLIPSSQQCEFPTFCTNCNCPAHFHQVVQDQQAFPEDFASLMTGQNITPQDLNFNSILAVFLIKDKAKANRNVQEITRLLVQNGIEAVSN